MTHTGTTDTPFPTPPTGNLRPPHLAQSCGSHVPQSSMLPPGSSLCTGLAPSEAVGSTGTGPNVAREILNRGNSGRPLRRSKGSTKSPLAPQGVTSTVVDDQTSIDDDLELYLEGLPQNRSPFDSNLELYEGNNISESPTPHVPSGPRYSPVKTSGQDQKPNYSSSPPSPQGEQPYSNQLSDIVG